MSDFDLAEEIRRMAVEAAREEFGKHTLDLATRVLALEDDLALIRDEILPKPGLHSVKA